MNDIKSLQNVCLEILKEVDRVCKNTTFSIGWRAER